MPRVHCKDIAQVRDILRKLSGEKSLSDMKGEILEAAKIAEDMFEERVSFLERRSSPQFPRRNNYYRGYNNRGYNNRDQNQGSYRPRGRYNGFRLGDVARVDEGNQPNQTETKTNDTGKESEIKK